MSGLVPPGYSEIRTEPVSSEEQVEYVPIIPLEEEPQRKLTNYVSAPPVKSEEEEDEIEDMSGTYVIAPPSVLNNPYVDGALLFAEESASLSESGPRDKYFPDSRQNVLTQEEMEFLSTYTDISDDEIEIYPEDTDSVQQKIQEDTITPEDIESTFLIPASKLQIVKHLSTPGYGGCHIYIGRYGNAQVCIKKLDRKQYSSNARQNQEFLAESKILTEIRYPHIVRTYGVCITKNEILLVEEFVQGGSMEHFLKGWNEKYGYDENQSNYKQYLEQKANCPSTQVMTMLEYETMNFLSIADQMACAVDHLSGYGLVHRDIAPRNILFKKIIDENLVCVDAKLCDFGLAKDKKSSRPQGAKAFLPIDASAPELFTKKSFSEKSDVWSLGILLYMFMNKGRTPYGRMTAPQILEFHHTKQQIPVHKLPKDIPQRPLIIALLQKCLELNPDDRPTAKDVSEEIKEIIQQLEDSTQRIVRYLGWSGEKKDIFSTCNLMTNWFGKHPPENNEAKALIELPNRIIYTSGPTKIFRWENDSSRWAICGERPSPLRVIGFVYDGCHLWGHGYSKQEKYPPIVIWKKELADWRVLSKKIKATRILVNGHKNSVRAMILDGGKMWSGDVSGQLVIYNIKRIKDSNGKLDKSNHNSYLLNCGITSLALIDGHVWVGNLMGQITVLNKKTVESVAQWISHKRKIISIVEVGKFVWVAADGPDIIIYRKKFLLTQSEKKDDEPIKKAKQYDTVSIEGGSVSCMLYVDLIERSLVCVGTRIGDIYVFDAVSNCLYQKLRNHCMVVNSLLFTSTLELWSTSKDGNVNCWTLDWHESKKFKASQLKLSQSSGITEISLVKEKRKTSFSGSILKRKTKNSN